MKKAFLVILLLGLSACAYVDSSLNEQPRIYTETPVKKSLLQVAIHPKGKQLEPLSAYMPPFVVQQHNKDYRVLGNVFAEIFYDQWLEKALFTVQEYEPNVPFRGIDFALDRAKERGADLLIMGYVPYFYAGNTLDNTAITVKLKVYSTQSRMLLWSMIQSAQIEIYQPDDYIFFQHDHKLHEAPFNVILRSLAQDMAIPLKAWLPAPDTNFQFAKTTQEMKASLAPAVRDHAGSSKNTPLKQPTQSIQPEDTTEIEEHPIPQENLTDAQTPPSPPTQEGPQSSKETGVIQTKNHTKPHSEQEEPKQIEAQTDAQEKGSSESLVKRMTPKGMNLDIHFDFDKATILPESLATLDALAEVLNSPELKNREFLIAGHTDQKGSDKYNLKLSKERAKAIKKYLVEKWDIAPNRMTTVGYGKSRPLIHGLTPTDQQKNRRVEIRLFE